MRPHNAIGSYSSAEIIAALVAASADTDAVDGNGNDLLKMAEISLAAANGKRQTQRVEASIGALAAAMGVDASTETDDASTKDDTKLLTEADHVAQATYETVMVDRT